LGRSEFEAAVKLQEQSVIEATTFKNTGTLSVELRRSVRNFTVSGHLEPNMHNVPQLNVRLIKSPDSLPMHRLSTGTGTIHDFNVHIICGEPGVLLPVGSYVFAYEASCGVPTADLAAEAAPEI
jgi:hypothetical protein